MLYQVSSPFKYTVLLQTLGKVCLILMTPSRPSHLRPVVITKFLEYSKTTYRSELLVTGRYGQTGREREGTNLS